MALTTTLALLRGNVRKYSDTEGTAALQRHPDADVNDYVNRALGAIYRLLTASLPDQRFLSSTTVSTVAGTLTYALPADFDHLISVDITANGVRSWLSAFEMHERAALVTGSTTFQGIPFCYRLRGANIEYLPSPSGVYASVLWYVPAVSQLSTDGATFDTISRLDDFVIAYAAKLVATKDKNWDLVGECRATMAELVSEIESVARSRDKNSPVRIVDECYANRWGRRSMGPRRLR